jgi:hypothetical protein
LNITSFFLFFLFFLCWVGVHCGIYKGSYKVSNISYLNALVYHPVNSLSLGFLNCLNFLGKRQNFQCAQKFPIKGTARKFKVLAWRLMWQAIILWIMLTMAIFKDYSRLSDRNYGNTQKCYPFSYGIHVSWARKNVHMQRLLV